MLNKVSWLDNLGRATRSKKNEKLENFLTDLQRLTIVHESDHDGGSHFRFASGADSGNPKEPSGDDEKVKKGSSDTDKGDKGSTSTDSSSSSSKTKGKGKETKGEAEKLPGTSGGGAAEGDKTLADDHGKGGQMEEHKKKEEQGDGPQMTDDEGNSSDHTKVDRHERRSEDVGGR